MVLMFLVQLGAGLGGISVLSHGMVYVDDNVEKKDSAALIGKFAHRFRGFRAVMSRNFAADGRET
jgi:hypothetical protein